MKRKDLLKMIEEGESLRCEFKQRFSTHEKIAKEIIAFANTKGGWLLFGVEDDGRITGVGSEKEEAELVRDAAENFCEPAIKINIEFIDIHGKEIVCAEIPESSNKPHRIQDYSDFDINKAQVYVRVKDKSFPASKEMIRIFRADAGKSELKKYTIGVLEKQIFDYLDKQENITVKTLSEISNISERRASRTIVKLVRAGLLLIHKKDNGEEFFTYNSD